MEHTPGPWEVYQEDGNSPIEIVTEEGVRVACMYLQNEDQPLPFEANAHLIAAAPDLLAACEAFSQAHHYAGDSEHETYARVDPQDWAEFDAARARARGEEVTE